MVSEMRKRPAKDKEVTNLKVVKEIFFKNFILKRLENQKRTKIFQTKLTIAKKLLQSGQLQSQKQLLEVKLRSVPLQIQARLEKFAKADEKGQTSQEGVPNGITNALVFLKKIMDNQFLGCRSTII